MKILQDLIGYEGSYDEELADPGGINWKTLMTGGFQALCDGEEGVRPWSLLSFPNATNGHEWHRFDRDSGKGLLF